MLHKNGVLTSKLNQIFTTKAIASESNAIAHFGDQLQATIKNAEAELPSVQLSIRELRVETDPVPEPSPSFLPHDLMPLNSTSKEFLDVQAQITGGKIPVRVRKVNVPERSQRFDAYVQNWTQKVGQLSQLEPTTEHRKSSLRRASPEVDQTSAWQGQQQEKYTVLDFTLIRAHRIQKASQGMAVCLLQQ